MFYILTHFSIFLSNIAPVFYVYFFISSHCLNDDAGLWNISVSITLEHLTLLLSLL